MKRACLIAASGMLCLCLVSLTTASARAADAKPFDIGGKYELTPPANWVSKEPKSRIIEYEFEIPAAQGDEIPGRVTVMGAGGAIDDNINRWKGQFKTPESGEVKADVKQIEASGVPVHLVTIQGTYLDKAGPFVPGPATERPGYRMVSAILVTKDAGQYFVKFYGPEKTIAANEGAFVKMIEGLKAKEL
jgi:hypothetical protein